MKVVTSSMMLAVAAVFLSSAAQAQVKPEDVIKFRKGLMTVQSWNVRPLAMMVKGQQPYDKDLVMRNAAMLELTGKMILEGFSAGSDKGAETRAKPEIWSEPEKFKQAAERFQAEATKLAEVSKAGTLDSLRNQFAAVSKSCGACHDTFRTK